MMAEQLSKPYSKPDRLIMIPIDGSKHCDRAFMWYHENLHKSGDMVYFIHVIEPDYDTDNYRYEPSFSFAPNFEEALDFNVVEGRKLCQKYISQAKNWNIDNRAFMHISGRPGDALVESCRDHEIDMIVMGNRGVGKIHRKVLGTVSDYVVHHAHKPVIVCNPDTHKLRHESKSDSGHDNVAFANEITRKLS